MLRRVRRARSTEKVRALRQGAPGRPGSVDVGAITFPPQLDIVAGTSSRRARRAPGCWSAGNGRDGAGRFFEPTVLADVDHSMDVHDRGDVRPDAADHEGRRRRRGGAPGQRLALRAGAPRCGRRTSRAARRSRGAIEAGACASTTRRSTTWRSSCRWAAGRTRASARATARAGIRKYARQQALLVTRFAPKREIHMFPYKARDDPAADEGRAAALRARQARLGPGRERGRRRAQQRELLAQPPAAAVLQRVHGVLGAAEPLRDLGRAEPDDEAQHHDLALV